MRLGSPPSLHGVLWSVLPGTEVLPGEEQSFGTQGVHSDQGPTLQVSTQGTKHLEKTSKCWHSHNFLQLSY